MSLTAWLDLRMTPIGLRPDLSDPSPPLPPLLSSPFLPSSPVLLYTVLPSPLLFSHSLFPSLVSSPPLFSLIFLLSSPLPSPMLFPVLSSSLFFSFYFSFHWYICFYIFHVSFSIFQLYLSFLLLPPLVLHSMYAALYIIEVGIIDSIREDTVQSAE